MSVLSGFTQHEVHDEEVDAVVEALAAGERRIVVLGPPGVGKSCVVRRALARWAGTFVEVDASAPAEKVLRQIARERPDVVLLDGVEPSARSLVERLPGACLVTSRASLDLPGERVVRVRPLPIDRAIDLLVSETRRRAPDLELDDDVARRICEATGGLPLAIELAAVRIARLGPDAVLRRGTAVEPRVSALLAPSWAALGPEETRALERLSVFHGGFDAEAAASLLHAEQDEPEELLERLLASSFVLRTSATRYEVVAIVRADAEARARRSGVLDDARDAHATHYARIAAARTDATATWQSLAPELANLRTAFDWCCSRGRALGAGQLAAILDLLLVTAGRASEHQEILERALAMLDGERDLSGLRADLAMSLGRSHGLRGRQTEAVAQFERALREVALDDRRKGWALVFRGFSLRPLARLDEAKADGMRAREIGIATRDARLECMAEQVIGLAALEEEAFEDASSAFERALGMARTGDAPRLAAIARANLGLVALRSGRLGAAVAWLDEARAGFAAIGDAFHLALVDVDRARATLLRGELDRAESMFLEVLDRLASFGNLASEADARMGLCAVALQRRDVACARGHLADTRAIVSRIEDVFARARLDELTERVSALAPKIVLRLDLEARSFVLGERAVDLRRHGPLRKLLLELARHRERGDQADLTVDAMLHAGWPGERPRGDSGVARVYMAIRRLRALGLESVLRTNEHGYALDRSVEIRWVANC